MPVKIFIIFFRLHLIKKSDDGTLTDQFAIQREKQRHIFPMRIGTHTTTDHIPAAIEWHFDARITFAIRRVDGIRGNCIGIFAITNAQKKIVLKWEIAVTETNVDCAGIKILLKKKLIPWHHILLSAQNFRLEIVNIAWGNLC